MLARTTAAPRGARRGRGPSAAAPSAAPAADNRKAPSRHGRSPDCSARRGRLRRAAGRRTPQWVGGALGSAPGKGRAPPLPYCFLRLLPWPSPRVLLDVVEVVAAHHDSPRHLGGLDDAWGGGRGAGAPRQTTCCCACPRGRDRRPGARLLLPPTPLPPHAPAPSPAPRARSARCKPPARRSPDRMRPRIDTLPVKGHFLSM